MLTHKKSWSRRDFLKIVGAAGMGVMFTGRDFQGTVSAATKAAMKNMPLRDFGKTGVSVPILGLGGSQNLDSKQRLLRQAVKLGVTYWDTAESYVGGGSEEAMGKYLETYSGDRKKIFLVTKSSATSAKKLSYRLDGSLKRLGVSYIDLFLIHGIRSPKKMDREIRVWSEKKKAEGTIRFIGFSSHSNMEECMMGAAKLGWIDGIMVTYNYRLMHTDKMKRAVEACVEAGIGLTAMKTQAGWSWGNVGKKSKTAMQLIKAFSSRGFTEEQAKLKAVWENPYIATICSEMTNYRILASNVAAARNQTKLSQKDSDLLDQYAHETAFQYCTGCATICESTLEKDMPVSDTLRFLMYARCYGELERARECFRSIPFHVRKQMAQADYTAAELVCPQGIPIGRLMKEAEFELA